MSYPFFDYFTFTMSISPQSVFTSRELSFKVRPTNSGHFTFNIQLKCPLFWAQLNTRRFYSDFIDDVTPVYNKLSSGSPVLRLMLSGSS